MKRWVPTASLSDVTKVLSGLFKQQQSQASTDGLVGNNSYGLTPDYMSFRNTYWGQATPVNYKILWKMFLEIPEIYSAVKTKVNFMTGDGYELDCKSQLHQKRVEEILKKNFWGTQLKDICYSQEIFGDAYIELLRGGSSANAYYMGSAKELEERLGFLKAYRPSALVSGYVDDNRGAMSGEDYRQGPEKTETYQQHEPLGGTVTEFHIRDAATIRVDYNEHGTPIKYIQRVLHRRVDFYPTEMVHLAKDVVGDRVYGMSDLAPLIRTAHIKFDAEEYNADWLRNGGVPRLMHKLVGFQKEQRDQYAAQLAGASQAYNRDILVAVPRVDAVTIEQVIQKNIDMQWMEFVKYLRQQIFMALQVPECLVSSPDSASTRVADVNMEMFDKHIRGKRRELEEQLNAKFFTRENFGYDDIEFRFKYDNVRENLKRAQTVQLLSTIPAFTPDELREEYGHPPLAETDTSSVDQMNEMQAEKARLGAEATGKFNPGAPGVVAPNKGDDREKGASRQNAEAARETKDKTTVKAARETRGSITSHPDTLLDWQRPDSDQRRWEHPRATNADTPESRYPFGAQEDVKDPREGNTNAAASRMDEIREVARNDVPNTFDLNSDRVFPKDKKPKKAKPREKDIDLRANDPERDEVDDFGNNPENWQDTYRSSGQTTSNVREQAKSKAYLEVKAEEIRKAMEFVKKKSAFAEKVLEVK